MAMLIQKFHRLIQSKLLWIVFLSLVVISFVFWGAYSPRRGERDREEIEAGELYGEAVPRIRFIFRINLPETSKKVCQ